MTVVGAVERVTLNVTPSDGTTVATLQVWDSTGALVALTEPVERTDDTFANWAAVVTYDQAGQWVLEWAVTGMGASGPRYQRVVVSAPPVPRVVWPPTLDMLKSDMKIALDDLRDDERLGDELDAAISYVQRVKIGYFDFALGLDSGTNDLPLPDADLRLGTVRLASRWFTRGRSPDGIIDLAEAGSARVPSFDIDIDRMLRIGRFAPSVFA